MVGNPSAPAVLALAAMALHAVAIAPRHVVVEERAASSSSSSSSSSSTSANGRRSSRKGLLRRSIVGADPSADRHSRGFGKEDDDGPRSRRRRRRPGRRELLGEILRESGAAFLYADENYSTEFTPSRLPLNDDGSGSGGCRSEEEWRPNLSSPDAACSNGLLLGYPSSWDVDPSFYEAVTFDNPEDCCESLMKILGGEGRACRIVDSCGGTWSDEEEISTTTTTMSVSVVIERRTGCVSRGWHADLHRGDGCTNDNNYPSEWIENPEVAAHMFRDTAEECCDEFYPDGECKIYDSGCISHEGKEGGDENQASKITAANPENEIIVQSKATAPFAEAKEDPTCEWHPSLDGGATCAYSADYPPGWDNPNWRHMYLYGTHAECCVGAFELQHCGKEVVCETPSPTLVPTVKKASYAPTPAPIRRTSAPTSIYFIEHFSGHCHDAALYAMPHYITTTYPNFQSCCEASFARDTCFAMEVVDDDDGTTPAPVPETWAPTYFPTGTVYYVEHFSGMCVDSAEVPMPHYVQSNRTKHFQDYRDCCRTSFKREECMSKAGPAPEPTGLPTEYRTKYPSYLPSSMPSGQPSLPTARPTGGDCSNSKWRYDSNFVDGCTNLEKAEDEGGGATLFFLSWQECCQVIFAKGRDCRIDDRCRLAPEVVPREARPRIGSSCESHPKYHPDDVNKDGCTNSLDFPESWLANEGLLFHPTAVRCCEGLYLGKGHDCTVRNVCAVFTDRPTGSPAKAKTPLSEEETKHDSCRDRPWHPDAVDPATGLVINGCSNAANYIRGDGDDGALLFDTAEECCEERYAKYGLECDVRDACPSDAPPCDSVKWHPKTENVAACSNHPDDYPPQWNNPGLKQYMFFEDFKKCCRKHFPEESPNCGRDDVCAKKTTPKVEPPGNGVATAAGPSCANVKWHPSQDFSKCTNDFDYPESWEGAGSLMFDERADCCMNVFNYEDCEAEDVCPSEAITLDPSRNPTRGPSISPTKMPTQSPSSQPQMPTSRPSDETDPAKTEPAETSPAETDPADSDDCEGGPYHPRSARERTCTNDGDYPELWDSPGLSAKYLRASADECCAAFYDGGPCNVVHVCSPTRKPSVFTEMPTRGPSTKMTTSAPIRESNIMDGPPSTKHCSGNRKGKCKAPSCTWNASQSSCIPIGDQNQPTPTPAPMQEVTSHCMGKPKKQCKKIPGCSWNASKNSCIDYLNGSGCEGRMYHPTNAKDRTCTNDGDYPELWESPGMRATYLLASSDRCCAAFYDDGPCNVVNVCSAGNKPEAPAAAKDCAERKWHPITAKDRICTNAEAYPPLWDTPPYSERYLSGSAEECCEEFYGDGICRKIDACEG